MADTLHAEARKLKGDQLCEEPCFASFTGLFLTMALLAACGAGTSGSNGTIGSSGSKTIKIGSEFPTSGSDTSTGKPAENGVDLAIQHANASNFLLGYTFVHVRKDDVGASGIHDQTAGQNNVQQLVGDAQAAGFVGPINSSVALLNE